MQIIQRCAYASLSDFFNPLVPRPAHRLHLSRLDPLHTGHTRTTDDCASVISPRPRHSTQLSAITSHKERCSFRCLKELSVFDNGR